MSWFQLEDSFYGHPKILRLSRRLGVNEAQAAGHVVLLWTWTLRMRPDGDLTGFEAEDVALASKWLGDSNTFVDSLVEIGLLDKSENGLEVHDWLERAERYNRSKKEAERRKNKAKNAVDPQWGHSGDDRQTDREDRQTDNEGGLPAEVVALWKSICVPAGLPDIRKLTSGRRDKIRARSSENRADAIWWRDYFSRIASAKHCLGFNDRGWKADFDFVIRSEDVVARVLEGKYDKDFRSNGQPDPTLRPVGQRAVPQHSGPYEAPK